MSCGRVPDGFHDSHGRPAPPAPRWIILPDDPPALRKWLKAQPAEDDEEESA